MKTHLLESLRFPQSIFFFRYEKWLRQQKFLKNQYEPFILLRIFEIGKLNTINFF